MPDFKTLRAEGDNKLNVRKALGAVVFIAPATADPVTALCGPDKLLAALPSGYRPLGLIAEDGLEFSREADSEEVRALGYKTEVRKDITAETHTVTVNALEVDKVAVAELRTGVDLSEVTPTANGEIIVDVPEADSMREYRLLAIAQDINKETGKEIYRAKFYPSVEISTFPTETWSTDPVASTLEFSARLDEEVGVTIREFIGGPGFDAAEAGYTVTAGS